MNQPSAGDPLANDAASALRLRDVNLDVVFLDPTDLNRDNDDRATARLMTT